MKPISWMCSAALSCKLREKWIKYVGVAGEWRRPYKKELHGWCCCSTNIGKKGCSAGEGGVINTYQISNFVQNVNCKVRTTDIRPGNNITVCFDETWWWMRLVCLRIKTGCWLLWPLWKPYGFYEGHTVSGVGEWHSVYQEGFFSLIPVLFNTWGWLTQNLILLLHY
jgi:hypothetical protein